jgi:hypothetical protein
MSGDLILYVLRRLGLCHGSEVPFIFNVYAGGVSVSYTLTKDKTEDIQYLCDRSSDCHRSASIVSRR